MAKRKYINEVFTPRNAQVTDMYVPRDVLEKMLLRSVNGSMHSFLFGESGSGKTWLYKKVLQSHKLNFRVANCARACNLDSLTDEIYSVCGGRTATKTGYKELTSASVSAIATAEISHEGNYELEKPDKLLDSYKQLNGGFTLKKKVAVIVLDNVETLLRRQDLLDELANIVILLDDERYSGYNVKYLIVGVPNEVIQYFGSTNNSSSVANRIEEIQKVSGLSKLQVSSLLRKGFIKYLKVKINDTVLHNLVEHVHEITLGVPQRIHEYCECLAYLIKENEWNYIPSLLEDADKQWLSKGLRESYGVVSSHLNSDETAEGRRNQVIYCIGKISGHEIDTNKIGEVLSHYFPNTAPESKSGIGQVLSYLCKTETPILKKVENSSHYVLADPRYLMCIRVSLYKDNNSENVRKRKFKLN